LFGCAVLTGVGAVVNTARVQVGASVAVIGLGGVGLAALIGATAAGARQIIAVDLSDEKLAQARELGATHTVNAGQSDAQERIRELSSGGVEFAFEFAGSIRALELAYRITRRGGTTVTPATPFHGNVPLTSRQSRRGGTHVEGQLYRDVRAVARHPAFCRVVQTGSPSRRQAVDRSPDTRSDQSGFDLLHEGKAIRQVVVFE
jgi:alcohol dehydrogenase